MFSNKSDIILLDVGFLIFLFYGLKTLLELEFNARFIVQAVKTEKVRFSNFFAFHHRILHTAL